MKLFVYEHCAVGYILANRRTKKLSHLEMAFNFRGTMGVRVPRPVSAKTLQCPICALAQSRTGFASDWLPVKNIFVSCRGKRHFCAHIYQWHWQARNLHKRYSRATSLLLNRYFLPFTSGCTPMPSWCWRIVQCRHTCTLLYTMNACGKNGAGHCCL